MNHYELPGQQEDIHVIPVSGGIDSKVLAAVMHERFPQVNFHMVFTDTLAEDPSIPKSLHELEQYLNKSILWLVPEKGLQDLVENWGGFLPGHRSRYCTKHLKTEPFLAWLQANRPDKGRIHVYIGLRADEMDRVGLITKLDFVEQHTPFRDMGMRREDVFRYAVETGLGIPELYRGRTRSGCVCCPFQSQRELVYSMKQYPDEFAWGEQVERAKMSEGDGGRYPENFSDLVQEIHGSLNWMSYPIPARVDVRTAASTRPVDWAPIRRDRESRVAPLFDFEPMASLFVGAEFFVHQGVGEHGVWGPPMPSNLVTFSPSRAGIATQLENHYWHRVQTAEVWGLTEAQMKQELKLALYQIHLPKRLVDVTGPGPGSYTWKSGIAYAQIRHVVGWVDRTLYAAGIAQQIQEYQCAQPGTWSHEQLEILLEQQSRITEPVGELMAMDCYEPKARTPPVQDEKEVTCLICSI